MQVLPALMEGRAELGSAGRQQPVLGGQVLVVKVWDRVDCGIGGIRHRSPSDACIWHRMQVDGLAIVTGALTVVVNWAHAHCNRLPPETRSLADSHHMSEAQQLSKMVVIRCSLLVLSITA
jgi:hypothetical protein